MPTISNINPNININRDDATNIIIASIAMEELALAHILNAEGEKLQYVLGTLEGREPGEVTICDIMNVNSSIQRTLRSVINAEMLLQFKLEDVIGLSDPTDGCKLSIRGQKIWRDGDNVANTRPENVVVNLLRDNEVYKSVTVSSTGNGMYTFACLPVWRDAEHQYTYQVDEETVPAGYTKTISDFNIINTVEPGTITINGSKEWVDNNNQGGERPTEITVTLFQNGVAIQQPITVTSPPDEETTVTFNFEDVPQFDEEGTPYVYTVDEADVTNYTKTITGSANTGFTITNTLTTP